MKVYRMTVIVLDFDEVGDEWTSYIENARYPNRMCAPFVIKSESVEIGKWDDNSPFNRRDKMNEEFNRIAGITEEGGRCENYKSNVTK